ncbi:MAG: PRD domain-containing protein, partial [Erysipelothrix sp.]|nr:PRD domain-containing protein [Erysipelothrix sp.]
NNVVQATANFQEYIIVGLGIGYKLKPKQKVPEEKIEKVFELKREDYYKSSQLVSEMDQETFMTMYSIIEEESQRLNMELSAHAYFTLIDHMNFAVERFKSGQDIKNMLIYDLKILYGDEMRLSENIYHRFNKEFEIDLPYDEVGFLCIHIVNGLNNEIENKSTVVVDAIFDILNIIRDFYLVPLKQEDLVTQRIMIHVKMLLHRVISGIQLEFDEIVLYNVIEEFQTAYKVSQEIQKYIEQRFGATLNSQELVYLTIHINRLEQMVKNK